MRSTTAARTVPRAFSPSRIGSPASPTWGRSSTVSRWWTSGTTPVAIFAGGRSALRRPRASGRPWRRRAGCSGSSAQTFVRPLTADDPGAQGGATAGGFAHGAGSRTAMATCARSGCPLRASRSATRRSSSASAPGADPPSLEPAVPVEVTIDDLRAGRDPVLEAPFAIQGAEPAPASSPPPEGPRGAAVARDVSVEAHAHPPPARDPERVGVGTAAPVEQPDVARRREARWAGAAHCHRPGSVAARRDGMNGDGPARHPAVQEHVFAHGDRHRAVDQAAPSSAREHEARLLEQATVFP